MIVNCFIICRLANLLICERAGIKWQFTGPPKDLDGERLFVRFEDGKKDWSAVKFIRVLPAELAHLGG